MTRESALKGQRKIFLAAPAASALARRWATTQLDGLGLSDGVRDDVELVLAELVNNALTHTSATTVAVTLLVASDVTVVVEDDSADSPPRLRRPAQSDESGRGMRIIEALAQSWGTTPTAHGKAVWARIRGVDGT